jgi:large subunit ribosomal protein L17
MYERVESTEAKVKELKRVAERIVSRAKKNDLASRRKVFSYLLDNQASKKLFDEIIPRVKEKDSGFFKTYHSGFRLGDNSPKMIIQLFDFKPIEKPSVDEEIVEDKKTVSKAAAKEKKIKKLTKDENKSNITTKIRSKKTTRNNKDDE